MKRCFQRWFDKPWYYRFSLERRELNGYWQRGTTKHGSDEFNVEVEITNRDDRSITRWRIDRGGKKRKKKWRATSETIDDPRSVSVNLIYIHGARVTSWLSILGSLGYRSHRWTSRGLIYRRTALPRLSEFVLERFRYRHSIDHKVLIKLESYLYKVTLSL